ncbi:MAG: glucokinase [Monoraphidium minutum]|nr:MAG: glucokinase [Monoraphidium minutum]
MHAPSACPPQPGTYVVTGDIGGTNARLSVWRTEAGGRHQEIFRETYPTSQFTAFEEAMESFLESNELNGVTPQAAALAVAGAVENNRCPMTNISWVIDGAQLKRRFGFKPPLPPQTTPPSVSVLNDFEAVGYGIPALGPEDVVALNPKAKPVPQAPKCVMGPGTGLGAAQLFWDSGKGAYTVIPGEGAHATFAPRGWRQHALSAWAMSKLGHCEIEEVACGRGLELIYEFLISDENIVNPTGKPLMSRAAPEITAMALGEADPLACEAVDMFLAIVGAEAGAMALRCLARGGVYVAGGIVPRLMDRSAGLKEARPEGVARGPSGGLKEAFMMRKGRERFQGILQSIPLYVVTNTKVGIIGSREYALRSIGQP